MSYRDDLTAATERLARLDEAHDRRVLAEARARLEAERAMITARGGSIVSVLVASALVAAFVALRQVLLHHRDAPAGSFELFVAGLGTAGALGLWLFWQNHLRVKEVLRIDAEIEELAIPDVRVPPPSLAEAHIRIAEREDEEDRLLVREKARAGQG